MGKASRWFRGLLGLKQPNPNPTPTSKPPKEKRRWSFVKSYREKTSTSNPKQPPSHPPPSYPNYEAPTSSSSYVDGGDDANKHAIAVAAATAAVAEAAVAAAQAAAAVVRLTNSGRCETSSTTITNDENYSNCSINNNNNNNGVITQNRGEKDLLSASSAAVVIQSHFRGYLARRALRALKGLVKLQALVRGHIMRRKTSETMRCMQAMVRAQARARLVRSHIPESPFSSTKSCPIILHPGPPTPEKFEQFGHAEIMKHDHLTKIKRNSSRSSSRVNTMGQQEMTHFGSSWSDPRSTRWDARDTSSTTRTCLTDDDRADRILEIDTGKPHYTTLRRRSLFEGDQVSHSHTTSKDSMTHHTTSSPVSCEVVQTLKNLALPQDMIDDSNSYCTAENSPQYCSAASQGDTSSRRGGPFTPTKSDGSRSFLSGYSDCPSYMSYTESSKAKMRSVSAPKQRPQYERTSLNKRYSIHGFGEHHPRSNAQRSAAMHASFTSKAYPGSGRLDRLGMPVKDNTVVYYSGYLN